MYPMYPNCFDLLTTHGVIAEDLVGYVTGNPSPYLQNYVAQRGGVPSLPGQPLPDPLPNVPLQRTPMADTYQLPAAPKSVPAAFEDKSNSWNKTKKILAGLLLTGLAAFGIVKGRDLFVRIKNPSNTSSSWSSNIKTWFQNKASWLKNKFKKNPQPQAPQPSVPWYTKFGNWFKNIFKTKP